MFAAGLLFVGAPRPFKSLCEHQAYLHRRPPIGRRPVAELAAGVVPPRPDGPVRLQGNGV